MVLGSTVEGFDIQPGDRVWVAQLVTIPGPVQRKATPTIEDPEAFADLPGNDKNVYAPQELTVTQKLVEKCFRRYSECHLHCTMLNRSLV